jgi:6-phosphogluconolactonase
MSNPVIKIFETPHELANDFIFFLIEDVKQTLKTQENFSIALSGGTTPTLIFKLLGENYASNLPWDRIHFYWGDERCVPPANPDSNYRIANHLLFKKIQIPSLNVHRIFGESNPDLESKRYSEEITAFFQKTDTIPRFDLIMLGMGEDGHTASLFPNQMDLLASDNLCEVANHPVSDQHRITMTPKLINNAARISILATGSNKSEKINEVIEKSGKYSQYPISYIKPSNGVLYWFLDKSASAALHP